MKLTRALKKQWINALLSGKYKQGRGNLYNNIYKEHCCIGVLGEVCGITKTEMNKKGLFDDQWFSNFDRIKSKIPKELIGSNVKSKRGNPIVGKLVRMNDGGKSFEEIANYIQKYL